MNRLEPLYLALFSVHTSPIATLGGKKTGGMNVYVRELTAELDRRGVKVDVFTRASDPEELDNVRRLGQNSRLISLRCGDPEPLDPHQIFLNAAEFKSAVQQFVERDDVNYDAIFSHYWISGWIAIPLGRRWRIPVAQMFHTLGRMKTRIPSSAAQSEADEVRIRGETEVIKRADRIIAATQAERAQLLLLYRADQRKIDVIPPGVDPHRFNPGDREEARNLLGLQESEKMLLFVGRIEPLKGIDTIFQAMVSIREGCPAAMQSLSLFIVGGDPSDAGAEEVQRLQVLSEMLNLSAHVRFIGAQSQDALPAYYRAAEALIMPSDYESFGMVALEAMACATPVIASEVGGLAFLVQNDETGYHVPIREPDTLANRIIDLLTNTEKRDKMGAAAHILSNQYTWPRIASQLLESFTMWGSRPRRIATD